jgi:hypothetical protein
VLDLTFDVRPTVSIIISAKVTNGQTAIADRGNVIIKIVMNEKSPNYRARKGNKSSEADSFRNIKAKHHTHLKMVM